MFDDVHELVAIIDGLHNDLKNKDKDIQTLGAQAKTRNRKLTEGMRQLTETIGAIKRSSLVDYYWKAELAQQISKAMREATD